MKKIAERADRCIEGILLIGCMPSLIILICIIGLFRGCMGYGEVTIDNSYMKNRYEFDRAYITDSTGNGYELVWFTTEAVTEARYNEIRRRKHISDSYNRLKVEAAKKFNNNLMNTDIYDFAAWAKSFDVAPDTVRLVNVFILGRDYVEQYQQKHPTNPREWGWKEGDDADFGALYIKENDIYPYNQEGGQVYRYWECDVTSSTDERYTHITIFDR